MTRTPHLMLCLTIQMLACSKAYPTFQSAEDAIRSPDTFPIAWNRHRVDVASAERANLEYSIKEPAKPIPFLRRRGEWQSFKSRLEQGSELWYWESPRYPSAPSGVRSYLFGYCITKEGKPSAVFLISPVVEHDDP